MICFVHLVCYCAGQRSKPSFCSYAIAEILSLHISIGMQQFSPLNSLVGSGLPQRIHVLSQLDSRVVSSKTTLQFMVLIFRGCVPETVSFLQSGF